MRVTANDIVTAIGQLRRDRAYNYINPKTRTKIEIDHIDYPEGPIYIRRYRPDKGEGSRDAAVDSISTHMIWRTANAISSNIPINIDRILGASYNTRSALEALLAHTPQFYYCYPGRIETINSSTEIKAGHKHLIWTPDQPHELGVIAKKDIDVVISEIPTQAAIYEALSVPDSARRPDMDIEVQRRHAQIQIALVMIGLQLGYRVWIAQNDKAIIYKNQRIGELDGVIGSLYDERILSGFDGSAQAALLIDCIWFRNKRFMPAVMEVEYTTGIRSGLLRMNTFRDTLPAFLTKYVIVAPDEDRERVLREANVLQFRNLNTQYMPFSTVEELYSLSQRRKLRGVSDDFLDSFMEPCLTLPA